MNEFTDESFQPLSKNIACHSRSRLDPVGAWQRVALQAAKEGNPDKLVEFSIELQRKLNGENRTSRRPSGKRKSN